MGTDTDRQAASVGRGAAVEPLHVEALSPCRNTPIRLFVYLADLGTTPIGAGR